jgi:hypothetical protein
LSQFKLRLKEIKIPSNYARTNLLSAADIPHIFFGRPEYLLPSGLYARAHFGILFYVSDVEQNII